MGDKEKSGMMNWTCLPKLVKHLVISMVFCRSHYEIKYITVWTKVCYWQKCNCFVYNAITDKASIKKIRCQTKQILVIFGFTCICFCFLFVWPYVLAFPSRQVGIGANDSRKIYGKQKLSWENQTNWLICPELRNSLLLLNFSFISSELVYP